MNANILAPIGGVEVNLLEIGRELAHRGHTIDLAYLVDGMYRDDYSAFCPSLRQVRGFSFSRRQALADLRRIIPSAWAASRKRPDVVYVNQINEIVYGAMASRLARTPLICHLHGCVASGVSPRLATQVDRFVAVSRYVSDYWLAAGVAPDRLAVVHNGIDPAAYPPGGVAERSEARERLGLPEEGFVALYYGRIDPDKGVEVLLDAWGKLQGDLDVGRLLLVGSPSVHQNPAYLQSLHDRAPAGCHWLPMQRDVLTPLHAADVVVLPAMWAEPFGRVIVETLSTGRPVVASRTGGIPEILNGPFERFLTEPGDAGALAKHLRELVEWRRHEPQLAAACTALVTDRFTLANTVDKTEGILLDVLHGP